MADSTRKSMVSISESRGFWVQDDCRDLLAWRRNVAWFSFNLGIERLFRFKEDAFERYTSAPPFQSRNREAFCFKVYPEKLRLAIGFTVVFNPRNREACFVFKRYATHFRGGAFETCVSETRAIERLISPVSIVEDHRGVWVSETPSVSISESRGFWFQVLFCFLTQPSSVVLKVSISESRGFWFQAITQANRGVASHNCFNLGID